jgi:hypothetical protein
VGACPDAASVVVMVRYFLRCRRVPRYHNVSVGDGVLDVPCLVRLRNLRQTAWPYGLGAVGCRCHRTRFARPGRTDVVVVAGIFVAVFVGDAALSVPGVDCSVLCVF